ncbi:MAG: hypothetical protein K1X38_01915 [Microthrixaceae bacterium]|nr:hypothetical protein [Microthrixaceae bacterium]
MTQYEQEEAGKLKLDTLLALGAACEALSEAVDAGWGSELILSMVGHPQAINDVANVRCREAAKVLKDYPHVALKTVWADGLVIGALVASLDCALSEAEES